MKPPRMPQDRISSSPPAPSASGARRTGPAGAKCQRCGEPESGHDASPRCHGTSESIVPGSRDEEATPSSRGRYNGWKNYETWCVHLWLTNEEATYSICREAAAACRRMAPRDPRVPEVWTMEQATRYRMADWLKEHVTGSMPIGLRATMASDLLNAALSEVDWAEIADAFLED